MWVVDSHHQPHFPLHSSQPKSFQHCKSAIASITLAPKWQIYKLHCFPSKQPQLFISFAPASRRSLHSISASAYTVDNPAPLQFLDTISSSPSSQLLHPSETISRSPPEFVEGKLLSELSTWGIGGPARYFYEVRDELQLASAMRYCYQHGIRFMVVGKGSNCLFDDLGFDGCILLNRISFLNKVNPGVYNVGSGYPFNSLGVQCSKEGFTGLEFASGIPGTVGGAVLMNAGADGQETADVLKFVEIVTVNGDKRILGRDKLDYSYRTSPFQKIQGFAAIVGATFELAPSTTARNRQRDYLERRRRTQPVTDQTAGCVFRNPGSGGGSAGSLIDQSGLKGMAVGGAKVSELHANFLVNSGNSKSSDMLSLIFVVKEQVRLKFGVELEEEIIYVPYRQSLQN